MARRRSLKKKGFAILAVLVTLLVGFALWFRQVTQLPAPIVVSQATRYQRVEVAPDYYRIGNNWLRKNPYGIWEMYLEGAPYERGLIYGALAVDLVNEQEQVFVDQIRDMIPREYFLKWLKYFVGWFNRDIDQYIQQENLEEIYGISRSFSDEFNFIGEPYYRVLNYHAAHDIGHALTDLNMVGCTSFAASQQASADSSLVIGRNFDFNMGDRFAENKLMLFMKPDSGYAFASVTWAGFTGVVSGMNEKGLTVTLNAAKSDIPYKAKTPISLLAREILQYAGTIAEAEAIARKRETFVSESLLIGSAADGRAAVLEKTPTKMDVYSPDTPLLICSNHYQSPLLAGDPANVENIKSSDSEYRYLRMQELTRSHAPVDVAGSIAMLRNTLGQEDRFIGYGNPKSINQLLAHHGIVFKPMEKKLWVSANPYPLGAFVGYKLSEVFSSEPFTLDSTLVFPADPFLATPAYNAFESFKATKNRIVSHLLSGRPLSLTEKEADLFVKNNQESYLPYLLLGDYYGAQGNTEKARHYYTLCLTKELSSQKEESQVKQKLLGLK